MNTYKDFFTINNFKEIKEEFQLKNNILVFSNFNKKLHEEYIENRKEIVESYFENLQKDLLNNTIKIEDYYALFLLEDGFDESQSKFFSNYFLQYIKSLNIAISNKYYSDEILDFTWNVLDRIFHECFHCEPEFEEEYLNELIKLKNQIEEIDSQDEHLLKQKIEQFI